MSRVTITVFMPSELLDKIDSDPKKADIGSRNALINSILSEHYGTPVELRKYAQRVVSDPSERLVEFEGEMLPESEAFKRLRAKREG